VTIAVARRGVFEGITAEALATLSGISTRQRKIADGDDHFGRSSSEPVTFLSISVRQSEEAESDELLSDAQS
jgi:hypothetical protein